jgi:hypothetical protein
MQYVNVIPDSDEKSVLNFCIEKGKRSIVGIN